MDVDIARLVIVVGVGVLSYSYGCISVGSFLSKIMYYVYYFLFLSFSKGENKWFCLGLLWHGFSLLLLCF